MGVVPLHQRTSKCSQPFCNNQKMVVVAPIPNTYLMKRSLFRLHLNRQSESLRLFLNSTFGKLPHQATILA